MSVFVDICHNLAQSSVIYSSFLLQLPPRNTHISKLASDRSALVGDNTRPARLNIRSTAAEDGIVVLY